MGGRGIQTKQKIVYTMQGPKPYTVSVETRRTIPLLITFTVWFHYFLFRLCVCV